MKEALPAHRQCGVPAGGCGKQTMDGLRRRVRHGCLPSRGACPGRDDAVSEARAKTACLDLHVPELGEEQKKEARGGGDRKSVGQGKECGSRFRTRWTREHKKQNENIQQKEIVKIQK